MAQSLAQKRQQMAFNLIDAATSIYAALAEIQAQEDCAAQTTDTGATQVFQDSDFAGQPGLEHMDADLANTMLNPVLSALVAARDTPLAGDSQGRTLGAILRAVRRAR